MSLSPNGLAEAVDVRRPIGDPLRVSSMVNSSGVGGLDTSACVRYLTASDF